MLKTGSNTVAICMAAYNGEKYIAEQITSIINQSYQDWVLFIHDDNSSDSTVNIVTEIAEKHVEKIFLIDDETVSGGSSLKNFAAILEWVNRRYSFNYYMFSDQDDYWLPQKIEKSIKLVKEKEGIYKDKPVLVHTDLSVVDLNLKILGTSFFAYRALNPEIKDLNHLLAQNNITGCTMIWNKALNEIVLLSDHRIVMHDWWIALVACCFGEIYYLKESTVYYRQHGGNVVGATKVNTVRFIIKRLLVKNKAHETIKKSVLQAKAFLDIYKYRINEKERSVLKKYSELYTYGKCKRIKLVIEGKYLKQGIIQIIGELLFI